MVVLQNGMKSAANEKRIEDNLLAAELTHSGALASA